MDKTLPTQVKRHTYHFIILVSSGLSCPGIPTTIQTMGVNITTIAYLRALTIEIGSTIILMVVEAQGMVTNSPNENG